MFLFTVGKLVAHLWQHLHLGDWGLHPMCIHQRSFHIPNQEVVVAKLKRRTH